MPRGAPPPGQMRRRSRLFLLGGGRRSPAMGERGRRGVEQHYSVEVMKNGFLKLAERACAKTVPRKL